MTIPGNPARRLAALALSAVLLAGCGGESSPADAAPELADQLARVDRAVAAGDEARIRDRVESLVAATEAARDSGRLDDEQADRILTAADALLRPAPGRGTSAEALPVAPVLVAAPRHRHRTRKRKRRARSRRRSRSPRQAREAREAGQGQGPQGQEGLRAASRLRRAW